MPKLRECIVEMRNLKDSKVPKINNNKYKIIRLNYTFLSFKDWKLFRYIYTTLKMSSFQLENTDATNFLI